MASFIHAIPSPYLYNSSAVRLANKEKSPDVEKTSVAHSEKNRILFIRPAPSLLNQIQKAS